MKRSAALLAVPLVFVSLGCGEGFTEADPSEVVDGPAEIDAATADELATAAGEIRSDRGGLGAELSLDGSALSSAETSSAAAAVVVDPRKALIVTDRSILADFTFSAVMDKLVASSAVTGLTRLQLYRQWWDTQAVKPGLGLGAHCNDVLVGGTPALNGFKYDCPRAEGAQATQDPFTNPTGPQGYTPLALVNRFDLAPGTGAHCGEYRVVFGRNSGLSNRLQRNFIIFEAVLPNPRSDLGIEGCRPVLNFWASQAGKSATERRAQLKAFYFTGLTGFSPVIHPANYGDATGRPTGQVRTNQFLQFNWMLREFQMKKTCTTTTTGTTCAMRFVPVTDKVNPFAGLFSPTSTHSLAPAFRTALVNAVPSLAVNDINRFNYAVSNSFNSGQSDSQDFSQTYNVTFGTGPSTLRSELQTKLTSIRSTLTPDQIVARAEALSCAGCHQLSNGASLGGGLVWPQSLGFVHVSEQTETGPDGPRSQISPALTSTFLPRRKAVMEGILNRLPLNSTLTPPLAGQNPPTVVSPGQTFKAVVTFVNTGTTAWTAANKFKLGTALNDELTWGVNRVLLASTEKIHLGQSKSFTIAATAPRVPGTYVFQWQMLREGVARFGARSTAVTITVR